MNLFKKLYCRVFQFTLKIALPFMPYREPKVYGKVEDCEGILKELKVNSVLLVTGRTVRGSGLTQKLERILESNQIKCVVYDQTCANPTVENVEEARTLYIKNNCQAIIAFGGGSSMDCAKAVGARIAYPKKSLDKLKGLLKVLKKIPPLIAIPTTAGTGSEVTLAAVITDTQKEHKYTLMDFTLIPNYAVLDPELTFSLPSSLTATTGMDALTHAVEAYIGKSTTRETREKAMEATSLIFNNIEKAYLCGQDYNARANMLRASYLAGIAFSKSYVGYVHAVAHSLGGKYNTAHGLANAVLLPIVLKAYGSKVYKKLYKLGLGAGVCSKEQSFKEGAECFIEAISRLNEKMGIPKTISAIQKQDIPHMAKLADKEANPLYPVPVLKDSKQLEQFYYAIAE